MNVYMCLVLAFPLFIIIIISIITFFMITFQPRNGAAGGKSISLQPQPGYHLRNLIHNFYSSNITINPHAMFFINSEEVQY